MTLEELEARIVAIEQDISDLKEAVAPIPVGVVANNETLIDALQQQVADLTIAQQACVQNCSTFERRISTVESEISRIPQMSLDGTTLTIEN